MALALPYLPAGRIEEGLRVVISKMNANYLDQSSRFERCFRRQWLRIASIISVHNRDLTTNNISEIINMYLLRVLGRTSNLWFFLGKYIHICIFFIYFDVKL